MDPASIRQHPPMTSTPKTPAHDLPVDKRTGEPLSPVYKRRISAKVRKAIEIRVTEGATWKHCAQRVEMSQSGLYKAIDQPHVAAYLQQRTAKYVSEIEQQAEAHKARALEVARELLDQEGNQNVRARMVEFLRGGGGKPGVSVAVQVNNQAPAQGYAYVRPGQQMVEIVPDGDMQSPDVIEQTPVEQGD